MEYLMIRLACSFLSGVLLSQSGSLVQLGTRNILASPSTLGIDGMGILWLIIFHSLALSFGSTSLLPGILLGLPLFILLGLSFGRIIKGENNLERILLLGLTFNLLVGAIFSLWQFFFMAFNLPFPVEVWFGHFRYADSTSIWGLLLTELGLLGGLLIFSQSIKLFSLGPGISQNFNLNHKKLFSFLFVSAVISTYVVVSFFGAFSFLGLIFPIVARKLWFTKLDLSGELLWGSLLNGVLLMGIDFLCYQFPILGAEVPVGLIVTAVGAVSLILLLWLAKDRSQLLAKH